MTESLAISASIGSNYILDKIYFNFHKSIRNSTTTCSRNEVSKLIGNLISQHFNFKKKRKG